MTTSIRRYMLARIKYLRGIITRQTRIIEMQKRTIATLRTRAEIRTRLLHDLKRGI